MNYFFQTILCTLLLLSTNTISAQGVSISNAASTPDNSAGLDVDFNDKGVLISRVSLTDLEDTLTISNPVISLLVYNTNAAMAGGSGAGYYFWNGSQWQHLISSPENPGNLGEVLTSQGPNQPPEWEQPASGAVSGGGGTTGCLDCITEISTAVSTTVTWIQCADSCKALNESGYNDWRMPTLDEAIDYRLRLYAPDAWIAERIWTSTRADAQTVASTTSNDFMIFWESTGVWARNSPTLTRNCRCVR